MVANFFGYKGHADVVQAAAILRDQGLDFTLLFVGRDGDASDAVRRQVQEGLTDRVRFAGPRTDIPRLLRLIDIFVSASHEEGFSNSILEAMASGRAIVATSAGGTVEQIDDGITGLLVDPRSPEALAGALGRLLRTPGLPLRLGAAAREAVGHRFSLEMLTQRISSLYREVRR
jgi:glycosyltransferase involved in cell wall biosynthesis